MEDQEETEAELGAVTKKPVWGSSTRAYPGATRDDDLEQLLGSSIKVKSGPAEACPADLPESSTLKVIETKPNNDAQSNLGSMFKKRKSKSVKQ